MSSATVDCVAESPARKRMHTVSQRRQNKPLIEKRRRARINECLVQLKAILMKDMNKETPRPSKLEKADILEMTVDYIKKMADKRPESKVNTTDTTVGGGRGGAVPFLNGFSRCLEEVDAFLNSQLPLQPEVRHKLLSHCKEQLSAKDLAVDEARITTHSFPPISIASTLPSASPDDEAPASASQCFTSASLTSQRSPSPDDDLPARNHLSDSISDLSSDDEVKVKPSCDVIAVEVKPAAVVSECTPAASTTTALVAPFQHSSSSASCAQSAVQQTVSADSNSGIKFAGPLKLICGGNVFIVVDQQQQTAPQGMAATTTLHPLPPSPPTLAGQVIYSPNVYSTSGFATYLPAVPQVNTLSSVGVGLPVTSIPLTGPNVACPPNPQTETVEAATLTIRSPTSNFSPPGQPFPEVSPNAGNDVNNNIMNIHHQIQSSVWRPW